MMFEVISEVFFESASFEEPAVVALAKRAGEKRGLETGWGRVASANLLCDGERVIREAAVDLFCEPANSLFDFLHGRHPDDGEPVFLAEGLDDERLRARVAVENELCWHSG